MIDPGGNTKMSKKQQTISILKQYMVYMHMANSNTKCKMSTMNWCKNSEEGDITLSGKTWEVFVEKFTSWY